MRSIREVNGTKGTMAVLTIGLFCLMTALNLLTPYICDDFTYRLNFATGEPLGSIFEIFPSMEAHSYKMNGRLISHGLAQLFMLLPPVIFDVINGAVFTLTIWLAHRLCGKGSGLRFGAFFCLLWLFLPVFGQVVLWQVGAVNYFWSLAALVLFITPELLRFQGRRRVLDARWKQFLFLIFSFFFGWYSEIASFVGLCMVVCLVVLDVWVNRAKFRMRRLLPVLIGVLGYLAMLSMPAQSANKQADSLTMNTLLLRLDSCNRMLMNDLMPLLLLFGLLLALALVVRLNWKDVLLALLFAAAGVCANYMPIAASYYPERCLCTSVLMLVMAVGLLTAPLARGKAFPVLCAACALLAVLTIPRGITGCRDILSCHRQNAAREALIEESIAAGVLDMTADAVGPQTPYSGYWGVRDLVTDPNDWPNHSMALYYGLDSLTGR